MTALALVNPEVYYNPGVSQTARTVNKHLSEVLERVSNHSRFNGILLQLENAVAEAVEANWDGYNAVPAKNGSYQLAKKFLNLLPTSIEFPEISIDSDGEVSFEWFYSSSNLISISFGEDGSISYSAFNGRNRMKGVEYFDRQIPQHLFQIIQLVTQ